MKATRWAAIAVMTIAAMSMGSPAFASGTPLSLTINPPTHTLPYKARTAVIHWRAVNEGTRPERVTLTMQSLTGNTHHCALGALADPASWGRFTPRAFILLPGQSRRVSLRLDAPSSAHGTVRVLAHFTASAVGVVAPGSVSVSPSIGSQVVFRLGGHRAARPLNCAAAVVHHAGRALPLWADRAWVIGGSAAVVALAVAATGLAFRHRRRHAHARAKGRPAASPAAADWMEQTYADAGELSNAHALGGGYRVSAPGYVNASRTARSHRKTKGGHGR
jgi:hypothetical protein